MTNGNWVCFDCQTSQRRSCSRFAIYFRPWVFGSIGDGTIVCPDCKKPCRFLGTKIAVPPKLDDNAWQHLRIYVNKQQGVNREQKAKSDTRRRHKIEKRILELRGRPENNERDRLIKELQEELAQLTTN